MRVILSIALLICAGTSPNTEHKITPIRLSDDILVFEENQSNGHMTVIATTEGLVVVDTFITPRHARDARKIIEKEIPDKTIRYVINTHFHADHCFGNQVFSDALIISYKNFVERIHGRYGNDYVGDIRTEIHRIEEELKNTDPGSDEARNSEDMLKFYRERLEDLTGFSLTPPQLELNGGATIYLGGKTIKILYFGAGHTDTDLVVHIPEAELLVMGDLLWNNRLPYIDPNESNVQNWISLLGTLEENCANVKYVIPGHGSVTGIETIKSQRQYLQDLWEAVRQAYDRGLNLEQAKVEIKMEKYSHYSAYVESRIAASVEACWKMLEHKNKD